MFELFHLWTVQDPVLATTISIEANKKDDITPANHEIDSEDLETNEDDERADTAAATVVTDNENDSTDDHAAEDEESDAAIAELDDGVHDTVGVVVLDCQVRDVGP